MEGGSAIRAGDRPVPTPRAPSQTLGGRARSPALPAGPVAAVTAVPVAADSPGGLLGDHPQPPTRLFGTGQSRRSGRCHISRVVSPSDGGKGVRESRGRWREVRCHLRRGLKRGPVELDGAGSSQGLSWEGRTGQDREAEQGGVHPVPTPPVATRAGIWLQGSRGMLGPPGFHAGLPLFHPARPPLALCGGDARSMEEPGLTWLGGCERERRDGGDDVRERGAYVTGSHPHEVAAVGGPGRLGREGVGRWSRGGWGGGRAGGSALSWKRETGEGSEGGGRRGGDGGAGKGQGAARKEKGKGGSKRG